VRTRGVKKAYARKAGESVIRSPSGDVPGIRIRDARCGDHLHWGTWNLVTSTSTTGFSECAAPSGNPIVGNRLRTEHQAVENCLAADGPLARVRKYVLPDDVAIGRDLEKPAVHPFVDQRIAVWQALRAADE
jgi:hypothetical protein